MALWPLASWTRWDIPDLWEYASAVVSAGCAAWTAVADPGKKTLPAVLTALAGASTLTAKVVSKWAERKAREEREVKAREVMVGAVRAILKQMREEYFSDEAGPEKYKHRVTLFVCVERDDGANKGKCLVIFARSGVHSDSSCTWRLDDNHPKDCRGVAGKVWYHNTTIVTTAACDWPTDGNLRVKYEYASSLEISVAEAEALNVKSRAFAGAPVVVRGRKWGVLLLDSLKDGFIADTAHKKGLLNRYTQLIGDVLTEVGV
jgi:hypothetical protein